MPLEDVEVQSGLYLNDIVDKVDEDSWRLGPFI